MSFWSRIAARHIHQPRIACYLIIVLIVSKALRTASICTIRGSLRKNGVNFITININIGAVVNDNLVSVGVGLHPLKR
jgi:hypothetical protein